MERIEWIVSDLDGTFLGPDDRAGSANVAAVERALAAGIRFSFATGRLPAGLPELPDAVVRHPLFGPHVVHNGAQVIQGDARLATFALPATVLPHLLDRCAAEGWYGEFYPDHGFFATHAAPSAERSWRDVTGPPDAFATAELLQSEPIIKATVALPPDRSDALIAELAELGLNGEVSTAPAIFPGEHLVNVMDGGVSKGAALTWIAARLGLSLDRAVVIGDGPNDLTMLRLAGRPLAIEGAPESVLAVAHGTLPHIDGVAAAVGAVLAEQAS